MLSLTVVTGPSPRQRFLCFHHKSHKERREFLTFVETREWLRVLAAVRWAFCAFEHHVCVLCQSEQRTVRTGTATGSPHAEAVQCERNQRTACVFGGA